jgi:hypothetical protein
VVGEPVTATRCPSKLDHHPSGLVLQCSRDRSHDELHAAADQLWADDDEQTIQGGNACCAGEWGYAGPNDMHSEDCPVYAAWAEQAIAQHREVVPPRQSPELFLVTAALRRAIRHLRDVADGRVQADGHTDRIVALAEELGMVLKRVRAANQTTEEVK